MTDKRTIRVDYLSRVEGEGALTLVIEDGQATEVTLRIFEPPRLFEAFLRGRGYLEPVDITSRICGICPVAYMMSACHAIEDAVGLRIPDEIGDLRRLLYCGEWIESHALHMFLLHAPDFLGYPDAVSMARDHREWVARGLAIKKAGNAIVTLVGGREIHPINVRVGGFYRAPGAVELSGLRAQLERALEDAEAGLRWMAGFAMPDFERDYEFVALSHPDEYPMCGGRIVSTKGLDIDVHEYEAHFEESQVPYSTALHSTLRGRGAYFCGPLARLNLGFEHLAPAAAEAAAAIGFGVPCRNPFKSLWARGLELIHALAQAIAIIDRYRAPEPAHVEPTPRAATGMGCTEAPRGILYHRYTVTADGSIADAKIVPPTSQNQRSIEDDLRAIAPELAALPLDRATWRAEQTIRNYDPCISCSTHFLKLEIVEKPR